jgi:hypothetical protein
MLKSLVILFATLGLAAPAAAQITFEDQPKSEQPAPGSNLKDPNKILCERQEEIGSRLGGKKVCHTAAEWQELHRQNREQVDDWQQKLTSPGKPAG